MHPWPDIPKKPVKYAKRRYKRRNRIDIMFIRLKDWDETTVAAKADNFNARAPMDMTNISVALDDHFFDIDQNPSWGKQAIPYADGEKSGVEVIYDAIGKLFRETTWKCGKQNGLERGYEESTGKVFWEGEFVNGVHHGFERTYYDNGILKSEGCRENGKRNGVSQGLQGLESRT